MSGTDNGISIVWKCLFWVFYIVDVIAVLIKWARKSSFVEHDWGVSEFLINYQGGFVRRGALGELIYYLTHLNGCYDPRYIILPLCLCGFALFCVLFIMLTRRVGFSWLVFPTLFCLFGGVCIRKDYLVFLVTIAAIYAYSSINQRLMRLVVSTSLMLVVLNIHEATFFYCVPLFLLVVFSDKETPYLLWEKGVTVLSLLACMCVLCLYKGDASVAEAVCRSWQTIYPDTYQSLSINSIGALAWDTGYAIDLHLKYNFCSGTIPYSGWILHPLALFVILVLMVRIGLKQYISREMRAVDKFIYISIVIFCFLLPMFTVLSCDFQRICFYWTVSSVLGFCCLKDKDIWLMNVSLFIKIVANVRNFVLRFFKEKVAYALLVLFSVPYIGNGLSEYGPPFLPFLLKSFGLIISSKGGMN